MVRRHFFFLHPLPCTVHPVTERILRFYCIIRSKRESYRNNIIKVTASNGEDGSGGKERELVQIFPLPSSGWARISVHGQRVFNGVHLKCQTMTLWWWNARIYTLTNMVLPFVQTMKSCNNVIYLSRWATKYGVYIWNRKKFHGTWRLDYGNLFPTVITILFIKWVIKSRCFRVAISFFTVDDPLEWRFNVERTIFIRTHLKLRFSMFGCQVQTGIIILDVSTNTADT